MAMLLLVVLKYTLMINERQFVMICGMFEMPMLYAVSLNSQGPFQLPVLCLEKYVHCLLSLKTASQSVGNHLYFTYYIC